MAMAPPAALVDLYSDTQSRPTAPMRQAMAAADVGDEQRHEDPTVNAVCSRVAELLGFEAAVFLPTGTMCNAIAFRLHVRPGGDAALLHRTSHPLRFEAGGPAAMSGAVLIPLDGPRGMFDAAAVRAALSAPGARGSYRSSRPRTWRAATCGRSTSCATWSTRRGSRACGCTSTAPG
jgi:threonine aldolase